MKGHSKLFNTNFYILSFAFAGDKSEQRKPETALKNGPDPHRSFCGGVTEKPNE